MWSPFCLRRSIEMSEESLRKKIVITAILTPETARMTDKEIEGAIRFYLKAEDIPLVEKIEKIEVLGECHEG